ncbi:MAG: pantetheine-phosphate adenylyltransferase [Paludibacteraceae bacterium]|nr:pantetheine-phosphate adenylyltransferase [Paludibacteraceae bacterium]MBQ9705101.1 pantetheine-phosphate adenylyltransferase [Paludibacteraceae bacterium]
MRTAIFPGSFDPFTIGHADIVRRALTLFDHITIGIGINAEKRPVFDVEERLQSIAAAFGDEPRVSVKTYTGLTVDFAREEQAEFILRGVRCVADFEYERNMAEANKQLGGIETILLYTRPEYAHISSTLVRDLYQHGRDISQYIAR